jgi:hypothetical protein
MPSRSVLLRALTAAALSLAVPAAADATVIVVDRAGHRLATPVGVGRPEQLVGWTGDGAHLVVLDRAHDDRALSVDPATGARTVLGPRPGAVSTGPGDRWVSSALTADQRHLDVALHAPDGHAIATVRLKAVSVEGVQQHEDLPRIGWSTDGTRMLVSGSVEAVVLDTATGAILRRAPADFASAHGLSPDGATLLITRQHAVWRIDVATGAATRLTTDADTGLWSPTGRVAFLEGYASATFDADADAQVFLPSGSREAGWTPDGAALTVVVHAESADGRCTTTREGVLVLAPDAEPWPLLKPRPGSVVNMVWSPDGTRAAIGVAFDESAFADRRGPRHPWPKRIRKDYAMFTDRGDRAVRRAVVRFAADLRSGMGRRRALDRLGGALERIARQPWGGEVRDTQVGETIADAVDAWLHAAGFGRIEALDELDGDGC